MKGREPRVAGRTVEEDHVAHHALGIEHAGQEVATELTMQLGGAGHGVGGIGVGAGGAVTRPLVFPAAATMVVFDDLNQHWPRLNVKNTHPFACHSALAQAMQHEDTLSAAMLPSPASWGLMSVSSYSSTQPGVVNNTGDGMDTSGRGSESPR